MLPENSDYCTYGVGKTKIFGIFTTPCSRLVACSNSPEGAKCDDHELYIKHEQEEPMWRKPAGTWYLPQTRCCPHWDSPGSLSPAYHSGDGGFFGLERGEGLDGWQKLRRQYLPTDVLTSKVPLQHVFDCEASSCVLDPI